MSEASPSDPNRCASARRDGQPCTAPALASGYCWAHDPAKAAERTAARSKGGKRSASVVRLRRLAPPRLIELYDTLEAALSEVHDGAIAPAVATAMGTLARAMIACCVAGEHEERIRDLERRFG